MRLCVIAIGDRMPAWVDAAWRDYAGRLPPSHALRLVEIPAGARAKGADLDRVVADEGRRMLAAIPPASRVVALDRTGSPWSTEELGARLAEWAQGGRDVAFLIGGPEGLSPDCRARGDECWSLSRMTFPHALARVIVAEQLYRAWTINQGHPYHRA